jgi:hypothetical protein
MVGKMDHTTTAGHPKVKFRGKNYRRKNRKDESEHVDGKEKGLFKRERRLIKGGQMKKEGNRKGKII